MEISLTDDRDRTNLLSKLVYNLADDPLLTNLLFTILRNPGITAKELKNLFPKLKGTSVYYYLNTLTKNKFLFSSTESLPNSNLIQKKYDVNPELFSDKLVQEMRVGNSKPSVLLSLFFAQQIINNQIHRILKMSEDEFSDLADHEGIKIISAFALGSQLPKNIIIKFNQLYQLIQSESTDKLGENFIDRLRHGERFFFICNLPQIT